MGKKLKLLAIHCDSGIKCLDQGISRLNSTTLIYRDFSSRSMKLESEGHSLGSFQDPYLQLPFFCLLSVRKISQSSLFAVCSYSNECGDRYFYLLFFAPFWTTLTYRVFQNHLNGAIFL